jgi:hypothetical protein
VKPELPSNMQNRLRIIIEKSYYIYERYNLHSTFTLLYHEKPLSVTELGTFVRKSDHFLQVDEHHYFINFLYVTQEQAYKAAENLIYSLDKHFTNQTSLIAIDTFDPIKTPTGVYNRLFDILNIVKENPYNRIEDETVF